MNDPVTRKIRAWREHQCEARSDVLYREWVLKQGFANGTQEEVSGKRRADV